MTLRSETLVRVACGLRLALLMFAAAGAVLFVLDVGLGVLP